MNDDALRALLGRAVDDVEPTDRLAEIRSRTSRPARRGRYAAGGAALLAAAVVVTVAVVGGGSINDDDDSADPTVSTFNAPSPTPLPTVPAPPDGPTVAVGLYFIGDTPGGPRLFREFQQVPEFGEVDFVTALEALATPDDPDYRTAWPTGSVTSAEVIEGQVRVWLADDAPDDALSLQQLRLTVAAASGLEFASFYRGSELFTVERDPELLAQVSISDPTESRRIAGSFTARGVADSFEATVPWTITDGSDAVVARGFATAEGTGRLHPWETTIDVSGLPPGAYTFTASTDDPSDGEGIGVTEDTRTVVVEEATDPPALFEPGVTAYYLGPGPDGPDAPAAALYRHAAQTDDPLEALTSLPSDPDYRTLWAPGAFVNLADPEAGVVNVVVDPSVRLRPAGVTPLEAALSVEQVVRTLRSHFGERLAVQFRTEDNPIDQVFGVPTSEPVTAADDLTVLSHMSIDVPAEGAVAGGSFTASGRSNGWEGSVFCQLLDAGRDPVWEEATVNGGLLDEFFSPWDLLVDLRSVQPGDYTFRCQTDDPTAGTEGRGTDVDTRTITVERP